VIFDAAGNLYGTTEAGGGLGDCYFGCGTVFQLSGGQALLLHRFTDEGDGAYPSAGVIFDQSGNLIGAAPTGPSGVSGAIFELTAPYWLFASLYSGGGVQSSLVMGAAGSLYGTDTGGLHGRVFKLTLSGGNWIFTDLHDFTGTDGAFPIGGVTFDANGNLYGTTAAGGAYGCGVVWEITP
jgi:uncharacterized repeat protein (TIGR03803 family)